jgi:hypothetical protein
MQARVLWKLGPTAAVDAAWKNADAAEKSKRQMRQEIEKSWSKPQHQVQKHDKL